MIIRFNFILTTDKRCLLPRPKFQGRQSNEFKVKATFKLVEMITIMIKSSITLQ